MKYQAKVKTVEKHQDSQGEHLVCRGKYIELPTSQHDLVKINGKQYFIKPLIISETEKIKAGDMCYNPTTKELFTVPDKSYIEGLNRNDHDFKVLATPENFSPKHLQAIIEGKLKDGEDVAIECEEKYFHGSGYYSPEQLSEKQREFYDLMKMRVIKLNQNNHIKLFRVEQTQSIDDKIESIMQKHSFNEFIKGMERKGCKLSAIKPVQEDSWSIKEVLSDLIKAIRYEHDTENLNDLELIANRFLENLPQSNNKTRIFSKAELFEFAEEVSYYAVNQHYLPSKTFDDLFNEWSGEEKPTQSKSEPTEQEIEQEAKRRYPVHIHKGFPVDEAFVNTQQQTFKSAIEWYKQQLKNE